MQTSSAVQVSKGTKYELTRESISNATATNEQLRTLVIDQRARRDEYRHAIEALEVNSDATGTNNLEEAIMWYKKFLGFQVVGGEGVKFVFSKIDLHNPDIEFFFCIKLNKDRYNLLQCNPSLKDSEELVKDLNCTNDLFKFVRIMRERFQAAAINGILPSSSFCLDTSPTTDSSQPSLSTDTGSGSTPATQSRSQSRAKKEQQPVLVICYLATAAPRVLQLQVHPVDSRQSKLLGLHKLLLTSVCMVTSQFDAI
ncbi:hypothetical protein GUJ93_ZPchr0001g29830 [Zizania palustris]|uniref:Kinetochore protein SPC25 n=1 Tax=Zizania palustris TaxID=103762 RepID=A0A8J5RP56_ZIZPA|nr:hypothetical protein GUJ93_ZPchr0001g29830 [Zizania palustris]